MSVSPDYFDKFHDVISKYMKTMGDGDTKASQIVTAVNCLVYGWFNNGDVFDTQYKEEWSEHCCNDISSYANWLYQFTDLSDILNKVYSCGSKDDYKDLLKELADTALNEKYLAPYVTQSKEGSIYEIFNRC